MAAFRCSLQGVSHVARLSNKCPQVSGAALCLGHLSGIGVVDVQKLVVSAFSARRTRPSGPVRIIAARMRPCVETVRVRSLSRWSRVNIRISSRSRGRLQGSGCKVAFFRYKSSTRSSGGKVATFRYESSTRRTSLQLRLQSHSI